MNNARYLLPIDSGVFMADPSAKVFDGKLYIYPSHDWDSGIAENDNGDHFNMQDYHVYSTTDLQQPLTDHGVILHANQIPWAGRQLWDSDVAQRHGQYYLYFSLKDRNDIFHLGVATAPRPEGPFVPQPDPIRGSYSIDPCVLPAPDGHYYLYFGGLWGGQLQRYRHNKALECAAEPADHEPALCPKVARLAHDMLQLDEEPRDLLILDPDGTPLTAGDHDRRFFEASWMHYYQGRYYFSYSTGNTHRICYAIGDSPYGPFTYQGVVLSPVVGWTTHHSIVEFQGQWYLFHHDSSPSGGRTWLRSMKVVELHYDAQGRILPIQGQ